MEIALLPKSALRIKGKTASFVVNPQAAVSANAVLLLDPKAEFVSEEAVVLKGAGEYEIGGVKITGIRNENASFGISDLKKGMEISVLGIYNKDSQRILARYIDTEVVPTRFSGIIASIDKTNYDVYIMTEGGKQVKVEIDTTSTLSSYTTGASLSQYGFSKLVVGDRVQGDAYPDKKDATLLIDDRLIDFLNAPKDPNISMNTPTPTPPATAPTSKGAKGITPIK